MKFHRQLQLSKLNKLEAEQVFICLYLFKYKLQSIQICNVSL